MESVKKEKGSSSYLPQDLIEKILLNLPAKSIPKLVVVSKLWSSIIRGKNFIDLYQKQSLSRPCFLHSFHRDSIQFFQIKPSQSLEAASPSSFYTCTTSSFPLNLDTSYNVYPPVCGVICFQDLDKVVVSNPSTGQFLVLPKLNTRRKGISRFLGYDPVKDEYKVLCMTVLTTSRKVVSEEHQVFTLGAGAQKEKKEATWRMIKCKVPHCPVTKGLCSNGLVYYGAWSNNKGKRFLIVCFDVRLEEFTRVKLPDGVEIVRFGSVLVNYHSKVALANHSDFAKFDMWVLEDVVKQEWSKISVVVPSWKDLVGRDYFTCRGVVSSGKFIFAPVYWRGPFCVISYDPKEDIGRRVVIEGLGDNLRSVSLFLDHVERPIFL
ncbi:PREDICTED: F-box/kelch-repeat protein At3g04660-like isoform X1 [Camelina sativa]|uniref:F-box/kelch-repeat protein At3g04660-like isoform X1 n=1 Tax=Camelina sativa TaxID=90675 RepID=A0ABM0VA65_CAMSA|nr:PREDICTED: F-box/kelch-repeat protein At3g04660-like isoform X1 [Camelina sativa]